MPATPDEPADQGEQAQAPLDFDPYRFGKPDFPVPAEFAPPGYQPPPPTEPPPGYGSPQYGAPAYGPPAGQPYGQPPGPPYPAGQYPNGPGGYGPIPPPYGGQYPPQKAGNGKATASLVLGIASILLCWLVFLDAIPVILALIFGALGRAQAVRDPRSGGKGMALAGMICAVVGAIAAIALTVVYTRIAHDCSSYNTGTTAFNDCLRRHI
jgi:hypothetical protein